MFLHLNDPLLRESTNLASTMRKILKIMVGSSKRVKSELGPIVFLAQNAKKGFIFLRLPEVQLDVTICAFEKRQNEFTAKGEKG